MQGSSLAIDLTAYQSLQLCAEGVTEVEVDANAFEEEEDYGEEKDSKSSGNSDNVEDGCLEILQVQQGGDLPPQDHKSNTILIAHSCLLITLYQWNPADNRHVRDAFLNCMKHRWSDNLRDEKLKWDKNSSLSARGAKNRSFGERVTHTTGSISFGIHEAWMIESKGGVQPPHQEKFKETHNFRKKARKDQEPAWINEKANYRYCIDSRGSDASLWPRMDNEAWVKAVGGCSSNFMPGIGSQVNLEMQLANMTEAQDNMSQTIAQSVTAALAAHGISLQAGHHPVAPPQPSHGPGSGLHMNSAFTYSTNSTQTSLIVLEYQ
ncbi:hypothetical protein SLEP1_g6601 [Rubroshorea leprosula]|uniref:Uncharacterized protein n=1 Tax=Rubroshorea leprosula TaxID=152421 RepID=A0AAV5HVQ9_9ROSI|nr:hypothetical protein SLEP1_g6601 [Rubroshorea leprosula]